MLFFMVRLAKQLLIVASLGLALVSVAQAQPTKQRPSERDDNARRMFESGRQAFSAGDYERALAYFRQAHELSGRNALLYNIAQTLDRLRRDEETLATLRQFVELVPDSPLRGESEARIAVLDRIVTERRAEEERRRAADEERARADAERRRAEEERANATEPTREREREREQAPPPPASRPPLHPAIFLSTLGVAVVAGGLSIWTGLETLAAHDRYTAAPDYDTMLAEYNAGRDYQLGTNVLIFSAAGLAAVSVIMLFFTDWGGSAETETAWAPALDLAPGRAVLGVERRF